MAAERGPEYIETLVIGGGQAGLSMAYQLSRRGLPYKIVEANPRIGDVWRNRWDSFRLFTPNRLNRLPGMRLPGYRWGFASKDEWADHLESYARKFDPGRDWSQGGETDAGRIASSPSQATDDSKQTTSWLRCRAGSAREFPSSRPSSITGLSNFTRPSTRTRASSKRETSSSWEQAILEPRSPSSWHGLTR